MCCLLTLNTAQLAVLAHVHKPSLKRLRQENLKFKAILGYMVSSRLPRDKETQEGKINKKLKGRIPKYRMWAYLRVLCFQVF